MLMGILFYDFFSYKMCWAKKLIISELKDKI